MASGPGNGKNAVPTTELSGATGSTGQSDKEIGDTEPPLHVTGQHPHNNIIRIITS